MAKISLASYSLKVIHKDTKVVQEVQSINGQNGVIHLNGILGEYFNEKQGEHTTWEDKKKSFSIQSYIQEVETEENNANMVLYYKHLGILKTGSYGYSSEIYNTETNQLIFTKRPNNVEMLPFFYSIYTPENGTECICVFERFGNFGFKALFEVDLIQYFKENYPEYTLTINPLLPSDYINNFINNGRILKLRLLKNTVPHDIADIFDEENVDNSPTSELIIKAQPRTELSIKDKVKSLVGGQVQLNQAFEVAGYEYDNAKIEVKMGRNTKTLDLGDLEKITGYFDITDDIDLTDGHPIFDSIKECCIDYAEHFLRERNII